MSDARTANGQRPPRGLFTLPPVPRRRAERTKAQTQDSRAHNRSLVLATLYRQGAMSRADLTRESGLTAPTISALVADLEADGLVAYAERPVDSGPRRGKPSPLVEIQDDGRSAVVLDLSPDGYFSGAVTDLRGRVVARARTDIGDASGVAAWDLVAELAARLVEAAPSRVLGLGVATPGTVDDQGVIRHAAHLGWQDLPMAARLTERFGVPAYVGNDANAAALAVLHLRQARSLNLMVILTEHGVGAGLVVDGQLVEGEQFAAGEIGHVTVDPAGAPCICGRRGCLDPLIDAGCLRERLAEEGPGQRAAILTSAGRALGTVLAPIACALNLNELVLVGAAELLQGPLLEAATDTVRMRTLPPIGASLRIRALTEDHDLILQGAACLVLAGELNVL